MNKQFQLVQNSAFGGYYLAEMDFVSDSYEIETFGTVEYYTDSVVFTGTIKDVIHFYVEMRKDNLLKGWNVDKLSTKDLKWINNSALNLVYEYKYLVGMIKEC